MPAKGTSPARKVRLYKPEVDCPRTYRTYSELKTELAITTNIVDLSAMSLAVLWEASDTVVSDLNTKADLGAHSAESRSVL